MLKRLLNFYYLMPLILIIGVSQYAMVGYAAIVEGKLSLWAIDSAELKSVGLLRYIKDAFVVFLAIGWVILLPTMALPKELVRLIRFYFLWLGGVVGIGLIGFLLDYSPLFFLPSGLRWLLLLHASFGVFILSSTLTTNKIWHKFLFNVIVAIILINFYVVFLQFNTISAAIGLDFGNARITGLFGHAVVAAAFAMAVALFVTQLHEIAPEKRIVVTLICMFFALSSGSRYATGAVFLIILTQLYELINRRYSRINFTSTKNLIFIIFMILVIAIGYNILILQVGRGDAIGQQFEKGGRVANFIEATEMLYSANLMELFFGRGLGIGTNTAFTMLANSGVNASQYRFNIMIDNAIMTGIFQFGLLGSMLFWFGIFKFILFSKPKNSNLYKLRFNILVILILMAVGWGNPFEQYFLMVGFSAALGAIYWRDRLELQESELEKL